MSRSPAPSPPLSVVGLALVVLSGTLLAVRVEGSAMIAVRALQVLTALAGAVLLGLAAGWHARR